MNITNYLSNLELFILQPFIFIWQKPDFINIK